MQDNFSIRNWKNTVLHEDAFNEGAGELDVYGYQTQHFDMCPAATILFKDIMAGQYTDGVPSVKEETEIIGLAKLHDALFGLEKTALEAGEKYTDKSVLDQAERLESLIYEIASKLDLEDKVKEYIPNHIDKIANVVGNPEDALGEQDDLEADDIELEIPGETPTVDKTVQAKASRQDKVIQDFKRLQDQMKTHLELYKTSESEENKKTALQMLKNLTPEFQAAKKKYEKLKGVKL